MVTLVYTNNVTIKLDLSILLTISMTIWFMCVFFKDFYEKRKDIIIIMNVLKNWLTEVLSIMIVRDQAIIDMS